MPDKPQKEDTLDNLFEQEAERQREEAAREDHDPAHQARKAAKREAEAEKLTRPGVVQEDADEDLEEDDEDDPHAPCDNCGDEHPENVLDGGLCPPCVDGED